MHKKRQFDVTNHYKVIIITSRSMDPKLEPREDQLINPPLVYPSGLIHVLRCILQLSKTPRIIFFSHIPIRSTWVLLLFEETKNKLGYKIS